jgi:hypothetical protein
MSKFWDQLGSGRAPFWSRSLGRSEMAEADQQQKIIKLLETAQMLADDLQDGVLSNLIEQAIDHAKHEVFPLRQPYWRR